MTAAPRGKVGGYLTPWRTELGCAGPEPAVAAAQREGDAGDPGRPFAGD